MERDAWEQEFNVQEILTYQQPTTRVGARQMWNRTRRNKQFGFPYPAVRKVRLLGLFYILSNTDFYDSGKFEQMEIDYHSLSSALAERN